MSNYSEQEILNKRNIAALNEGMKYFEAERQKDVQQVAQLQATVAQLVQQVQNLQVQVALMRVNSSGHGSTTT